MGTQQAVIVVLGKEGTAGNKRGKENRNAFSGVYTLDREKEIRPEWVEMDKNGLRRKGSKGGGQAAEWL